GRAFPRREAQSRRGFRVHEEVPAVVAGDLGDLPFCGRGGKGKNQDAEPDRIGASCAHHLWGRRFGSTDRHNFVQTAGFGEEVVRCGEKPPIREENARTGACCGQAGFWRCGPVGPHSARPSGGRTNVDYSNGSSRAGTPPKVLFSAFVSFPPASARSGL